MAVQNQKMHTWQFRNLAYRVLQKYWQ